MNLEFEKQLSEIGKITSYLINSGATQMSELDKWKATLKAVLNDDNEYNRLVDVFMAAHNIYGIQTEMSYLERVVDIAKKGISTRDINHYLDLRKYALI